MRFANHLTSLGNQLNCVLRLMQGALCGKHKFALEATKQIKAGKEWLINYGPLLPCAQRVPRKSQRYAVRLAGTTSKKARATWIEVP